MAEHLNWQIEYYISINNHQSKKQYYNLFHGFAKKVPPVFKEDVKGNSLLDGKYVLRHIPVLDHKHGVKKLILCT